MVSSYLMMVLHAHLPFVRHPEHEYFLEEDWLFEAITETYIPLIKVFDGLVKDGIDFRLTMSLTPTLLAMLNDPLLQYRYVRHISRLMELTQKEMERTRLMPEYNRLARWYHTQYRECYRVFVEEYNYNIIHAFRKFMELGKLEIITCCATHGFLPTMVNPNAMRAQIRAAVKQHETLLGRPPRGIWLAECGYTDEVDVILKENNLFFFFLDTHGILFASPRPQYGVYAPIYTEAGVAAFGRDMESSKQVWSSKEGYPGDYTYREFYRDIGFDLDYEYLKPYLPPLGHRTFTGIKYYGITGETENKKPYDPEAAREKAAEHAGHFMFNRQHQGKYLQSLMGRPPVLVAPYDAELFGHWWFEGPHFINYLFRKMYHDQKDIKPITPPEYLEHYPKNQICRPNPSSWGYKGYNEYWLNKDNDWIYRHLHALADKMINLAQKYNNEVNDDIIRALNQAAREVLLAQASDWAFIMTSGTMVQYALKRTREHIYNFLKIEEGIYNNSLDLHWLKTIEEKNNIFPHMDYHIFL